MGAAATSSTQHSSGPWAALLGAEPVLPDRIAAAGRAASAITPTDHRRRGLANRCFPTHGTLPGHFRRSYSLRYLLVGRGALICARATLLSDRPHGDVRLIRGGPKKRHDVRVHLLFTGPNPDRYCRGYGSLDRLRFAAIIS